MIEVGKAKELAWGVEQIAPYVVAEKCVLFIGSAVHAGPPDGSSEEYPESHRPLSAWGLGELLAERAGFAAALPDEVPASLVRAALLYELTNGRAALIDEIERAVQRSKQPSPLVQMLADLPFRVCFTTNYDTLYEDALRTAGKRPGVAVYQKDWAPEHRWNDDPTADAPYVVKLHGDIVSGRESIVVTDEDYINFLLRMHDPSGFNPVPDGVKHYLSRAGWCTLFLGYSLKDYNLKLLFRALRRGIDKANLPKAYSIDYAPDPLLLQTWQARDGYVFIVEDDIWDFVPALCTAVEDLAGDTA